MRFPGQVSAILLVGVFVVGCKPKVTDTPYGQTLDIQVTPASIESGTAATIMADVKEAMMPKPGVKVTFAASGNCGSLSAATATTQTGQSVGFAGDGQAIVTFTGNSPYSTCSAIITVTAQDKKTTMITVTPKGLTRTAPDSAVPAGETAPSVVVIPELKLPVSDGFSSQYSVTATGANIDTIRIVTSQKCTFSTINGATVVPNPANPNDVQLIEPQNSTYSADVVTATSDSLKLGKLQITVILTNPFGGHSIDVSFNDPATGKGALPGPG